MLKNILQVLIVNNFLPHSWMTFKFWYYIAEESTIFGYKFGGIAMFHSSVKMHSFKKLVSDFGTFLQLCKNKNFHWVCTKYMNTKTLHSNLPHLLWSLQRKLLHWRFFFFIFFGGGGAQCPRHSPVFHTPISNSNLYPIYFALPTMVLFAHGSMISMKDPWSKKPVCQASLVSEEERDKS